VTYVRDDSHIRSSHDRGVHPLLRSDAKHRR
jgi:hypothetical protein